MKKTWIAVAAVAALAGAAAVIASWPPATRLAADIWHGDGLRETRQEIADPTASEHWRNSRVDDKGVTVWDPINALRGFTLYTTGEGSVARLVTMNGALVHEWRVPFSTVWNKEEAAVKEPQPDGLVFLRHAELLPNGDLVAVYEAAGHVPDGYGLVRIDKESKPVWRYLQRAHGVFDMAPDGRVYVLVQTIREDAGENSVLEAPFLEDAVAVLSPDGKETARISLVEALERSRYASLLGKVPAGRHDPLGATSVQYMDDEIVKGVGDGAGERLLVSLGGLDTVAVLDLASKQIVWAAQGDWDGQHEARVAPGGDLLLTEAPDGAEGRVLQVDMATSTVTWSYGGTKRQPLYGTSRLSARRLANGNTLITDSGVGRVIEVSEAGTVVWEYTNPTRRGQADAYIPVIASAQRIDAEALDDSFRGFKRP
ncbi:MAG: arylsulfotransferase family protein [Sphingomonadales bacterium]